MKALVRNNTIIQVLDQIPAVFDRGTEVVVGYDKRTDLHEQDGWSDVVDVKPVLNQDDVVTETAINLINGIPTVIYTVDTSVKPKQVNMRTLDQRLVDALAANQTYLAIVGPTNAQNTAQIKSLTRQVSALIRLFRRQLDATD